MNHTTLVELAKSLGIMETIYCDGERPSIDQTCTTFAKEQIYDFLIVIDFEATCWESTEVKWKQPEIIEFPAVLLNLKTGNILSEFHQYLLPVESARLSDFCTNLTGITQNKIDAEGIPLATCLMLFDKWLKEMITIHSLVLPKTNRTAMQGNCAFATWSDWDLGICLLKECARKRLKKNSYFDQWIDIKYVYKKWYKYSPKNFAEALQHVGSMFRGREHSGIDDSRNIASLAHLMGKEGAPIVITKDLKPFMVFNKI